jgi:hypothetical protein
MVPQDPGRSKQQSGAFHEGYCKRFFRAVLYLHILPARSVGILCDKAPQRILFAWFYTPRNAAMRSISQNIATPPIA